MKSQLQHFRVDKTHLDRTTIWVDVAERSVNVLFEPVFHELDWMLSEIDRSGSLLPLVFRSAKKRGFIVGADLRRILSFDKDSDIQEFLLLGQSVLGRLERCRNDTVALIEGPCLGGGLEFAMACKYRIACNSPSTQLGMPEAKIGLMPGWGGTQRLTELVGLPVAFSMLMGGEPVAAQIALDTHLIDGLFDSSLMEEYLTDFLSTINASGSRPPDQPTTLEELDEIRKSSMASATLAQQAILEAVSCGILKSRESGFQQERELFFALLVSPTVRESLQRFAGPPKIKQEPSN